MPLGKAQNYRMPLGKVIIHFAANQKFTKWCEKLQNLQTSSSEKMLKKAWRSWLRLKVCHATDFRGHIWEEAADIPVRLLEEFEICTLIKDVILIEILE